MYWSDLGMNAVFRINKTDGSGVETIVDGLEEPMGLKIVYRRDPEGREGRKLEIYTHYIRFACNRNDCSGH